MNNIMVSNSVCRKMALEIGKAIRFCWVVLATTLNNKRASMSFGKVELFREYPDVVGVETLCEMLGGISKKLAYTLLGKGEIQAIKIGRSYKIPKQCVVNYLMGKIGG